MHLIKILSFILICLSVSACGAQTMTPQAALQTMLAPTEYDEKWQALRSKGQHEELIQEVLTITEPKKAIAALHWLRKVTLLQKETHYAYPFMYSMMLHKTGYIDGSDGNVSTALAMRTHALLLQKGDALRCDDNGVGTREYVSLMRATAPIYERSKQLSKKEKDGTKEFVQSLQKRVSERAPRKEACYSGAKYMVKALDHAGTTLDEKKTGQGTVVSINPSADIPVEFVSELEWYKRVDRITYGEMIDKLIY